MNLFSYLYQLSLSDVHATPLIDIPRTLVVLSMNLTFMSLLFSVQTCPIDTPLSPRFSFSLSFPPDQLSLVSLSLGSFCLLLSILFGGL